ncbi:carboxymuconolactone decarboxylase family protein, partial [Methylobacterium sp. NPDC080182]|uniref:carboxymuconolactone decarboxylase family protein n=1 Tax=Methylobacterium sp. NPDC080182 TaxID=3390590 RepID=UPI003D054382
TCSSSRLCSSHQGLTKPENSHSGRTKAMGGRQQINGCAHCIDLHTRDLLKTMPFGKVALVPVWAEVPQLFSDQYRAALAWAEEVTLVSETHASDEAYAAASAAFTPKDLVDLTIAIAAMNAFNRLGAPFRLPVVAKA